MATYNGHQEDSSGNILLAIPNSMATTIETGSTASQAYTKGSYFYYNNRLVKATSAISSGASLTIGSNISYVNAADELSAHLRANDSNRSEFYFDVYNGQYGYYPNASKTASSFVPFGGTSAQTKTGTFTGSTSSSTTVALGFKAKYLSIYFAASSSVIDNYNQDVSTTKYRIASSSVYSERTIGGSSNAWSIDSISDTGFTINKFGTSCTAYYYAIG